MPKVILLFADGTGNSASKLFKTNVWRLYQASDLAEQTNSGGFRQIAFYHDGVGTSAFKPLQLLGGIFGVGLKRNVVDMYQFVCRNYERGDRLFLFGFSRGAFTARVLAGLLLTQGIIRCETEQELAAYAPDAYRFYRRRYKLPLSLRTGKDDFQSQIPERARRETRTNYFRKTKVGLVDRIRDMRDCGEWLVRRLTKRRQYSEVYRTPVPRIDFIGVWDTVSAYGLPLEELTRGIDEWVWPLSMPNTELSERVLRARHALALDEERDSFQPLLWDEHWDRKLVDDGKVAPGRLLQVWFAGVHSNIGGGYADDNLSHVPLQWMMQEAQAAGLRLKPVAEWGWTLNADPFGRLYDSRSGISGYYRPQSRRLVSKMPRSPPGTLLLQDPQVPPKLLSPILVHESVITRIKHGNDRYAPTTLPPTFNVVGPAQAGGSVSESPTALQTGREEWVFDDVWRRRVVYFATVAVSLALAAFPLIQYFLPPSACVGPQCLLAPVISGVGAILPSLLGTWIEAFKIAPGWFVLTVLSILGLMGIGSSLKSRIQDDMRELWIQSYGLPVSARRLAPPVASAAGAPAGWIYHLRTHKAYQRGLQQLKWQLVPSMFGAALLLALCLFTGLILFRFVLSVREGVDRFSFCAPSNATASPGRGFVTSDLCSSLGVSLSEGKLYRLSLTITERWSDDMPRSVQSSSPVDRMLDRGWLTISIPASPGGIRPDDRPWWFGLATPLRRSLSTGWFEPILRIKSSRGFVHLQSLNFEGQCDSSSCGSIGETFSTEFKADRDGEASLFVNDAIGMPASLFYENNKGAASFKLERRDGAVWTNVVESK